MSINMFFDYNAVRLSEAVLSALDNGEPKEDIINAFNCGLMGVSHRLAEITDKVKKCRKKSGEELCKRIVRAIDGWERRQALPSEEQIRSDIDESMRIVKEKMESKK